MQRIQYFTPVSVNTGNSRSSVSIEPDGCCCALLLLDATSV